MNFFEVFELPRRLAIDGVELQRRFHALARRHHPDFHQRAGAAEQVTATEMSALVNAAYRALRDPLTRIEYLIRLEEGRGGEDRAVDERPPGRRAAPPELLEEMFEVQEALQEAKAGGLDEAGRASLAATREELRARYRAEEEALVGPLSARWDAAAGVGERAQVLATCKEGLARRAYLRTVIDDLGEALGEGRETHGTHHRH